MTRVTFDQAALEKLQGHHGRIEICDHSGRIVGYFTPVSASQVIPVHETVNLPFDKQQLDQFEQEAGGRPLKEILADFESGA